VEWPPKPVSDKVTEYTTSWTCSCGKRLNLTAAQVASGSEVCPHCGHPVGHHKKDTSALSPTDTQMINISDMARMAQEGLDPTVSGEWDTSKPLQEDSKGEPEKG